VQLAHRPRNDEDGELKNLKGEIQVEMISIVGATGNTGRPAFKELESLGEPLFASFAMRKRRARSWELTSI
jgi:hypothetical protein